MWGESISGGRGEARRVGRWDCRMRRAVAKSEWVSTWFVSRDAPSEAYSCPALKSARLVIYLQFWHEIVRVRDGSELSW